MEEANKKLNELNETQKKDLYKSGLSDETISKTGYTNETVYYQNKKRSALGIQYRNPITKNDWFKRYRFDEPVQDDNGKSTRYYQKKGTKVQPYCTKLISDEEWETRTKNPAIPSAIGEGEKKMDCFAQYQVHDRLVIGLSGVYGWSKGQKQLNDFIANHIAIPNREILIIYDSDILTNTSIELAALQFAKILLGKGCIPYLVIIPGDPDNPDEKVGIDDYLMKYPVGQRSTVLEKLIESKSKLTKTKIEDRIREIKNLGKKQKLPFGYEESDLSNDKTKPNPIFEDKEKYDVIAPCLAKLLTKEKTYISEISQGKEVLYEYIDGPFKECHPLHFRKFLSQRFTAANKHPIRERTFSEVKDLVAVENIPWRQLTQWEIPLKDLIWDCLNDTKREHKPENYLQSVVNVNSYDPNEQIETPNWDKFVENISMSESGDVDSDKITLFHEIFGFFLTQRALLKKMFIFKGEPNSGKTLSTKLLKDIIGGEFVTAFKLHKVDDDFGLEVMPNKLLAIDSEPKKDRKSEVDGAILKQLTGGEEDQYINSKHKSHVSSPMSAKILLLANTLPNINDDSGVIFDRIIIFTFDYSVPNPDLALHEKLKNEYPGIVHKAIKAFSKVAKRAAANEPEIFTMPESSIRALEKYRAQNTPVLKYCLERIVKVEDPNKYISFNDLFADYNLSVKRFPDLHLKPMSKNAFARVLKRTRYKTEERRPKVSDKRKRCVFAPKESKNITALWGYELLDMDSDDDNSQNHRRLKGAL